MNQSNNIIAKINKIQENSKCRTCVKAENSANHVVSKCRIIKDGRTGFERRSIGKYVENIC